MAEAARVDLRVDRWTPYVETFRFKGINLTGATLKAQIRPKPDNPGSPLIDLAGGVSAGAEGLRLAGVDTSGLYPISTVEMRINVGTLADASHAPAALRVGEEVQLAWDMHITPSGGDRQKWLFGSFIIVPGVTKV
jgi:hypothetical protein